MDPVPTVDPSSRVSRNAPGRPPTAVSSQLTDAPPGARRTSGPYRTGQAVRARYVVGRTQQGIGQAGRERSASGAAHGHGGRARLPENAGLAVSEGQFRLFAPDQATRLLEECGFRSEGTEGDGLFHLYARR